ncbi:MAG: MFS transporter [Candidatus Riflebacteria bacterium]|nr:MFS transporter [Candidatus Riflebacteria bacterium]
MSHIIPPIPGEKSAEGQSSSPSQAPQQRSSSEGPSPETRNTSPLNNPWVFVPVLYFLEGIPYFIVATVSVTMLKNMGISNGSIGLWTSLITFPWILKMLWGPLVEGHSTKRGWIVGTQLCIIVTLILESFSITQTSFLNPTLVVLTLMAFLSATHDIAADGFYLLALSSENQAFFVGIRGSAYRLANIFTNGGLIFLAGKLQESSGAKIAQSWQYVLWISCGLYALLVGLNFLAMPRPRQDAVRHEAFPPFAKAFREYFTQPHLLVILWFILFYRFGESMVVKMSNPFLLDAAEKGGLALSTSDVGFIGGVVGVSTLIIGGILGGIYIAKYTLKRCLWPMVFAMNLPIILYVWAAWTHPGKWGACLAVGVDNLGYGFGFAAYMVFLMFLTEGSRYRTAHYAISTGLMALGAMLAGSLSGFIQESLGYTQFFLATLILSIPGMAILPFLPLDKPPLLSSEQGI